MKTETLQLQVSLMDKFTQILLGIESHGSQYSADSVFNTIDAELNLLKVKLGENNLEYKQMVERKAQVELKLAESQQSAEFI